MMVLSYFIFLYNSVGGHHHGYTQLQSNQSGRYIIVSVASPTPILNNAINYSRNKMHIVLYSLMCLIGLKEGFGEGLGEELEVVEELEELEVVEEVEQ